MSWPRRILLSPCDYLVFNHSRFMRHKQQGEYVCIMVVETDDHPEPERVRQALARAFVAHPIMAASLRVSWLYGRPYWAIPRLNEVDARIAAALAHRVIDLRHRDDCEEHVQASLDDSLSARWDHSRGPQLRIDQYTLPGRRTRFALRWLHFLMDAEGAQHLLGDIDRLDPEAPQRLGDAPGRAEAPPSTGMRPVDPLQGLSRASRWRLAGRCLGRMRQPLGFEVKPLSPHIYPPATDHRCRLKTWERSQYEVIRGNAKRTTPPGPGLYARHLIGCTVRALDRVYASQGVTTEAYVLAVPFRTPLGPKDKPDVQPRPVHGNYLVPMTICVRRELAADRSALGEDVLRQYQDFTADRSDAMWSAMMWALGHMRLSMYQALLRLQLGFVPLASGFSCYGEIEPPLRQFLGGRVLNLYGGGVVASPPGWNLVFSRFDDLLNLCVTYPRPAVSDEVTKQYLRWIEEEMFAG